MFIYCFDDDLRNRLIKDQHRLVYEGSNEKGNFWCFEMKGQFEFSESDKEGQTYIYSKRMTF